MVEPTIVPRSAHPILSATHRSRRSQGPLPAARAQLRRVSRRRLRSRSAARSPAQGLRHRHVGAPASGQEAVPELLDHRPAVPPRARQVRHQDHRGRDLPPSGRLGTPEAEIAEAERGRAERGRPVATRRRRPRRSRARRQPDRLIQRDNTYGTPEEDAFRRDFTVNALFYDIGNVLDHRLRRRTARSRRPGDPLHRRSRRAVPRGSGPHAARRGPGGAAGVHDRRTHPRVDRRAQARDRAQRAGAAGRGVLQDPALGARGRGVQPAALHRTAEGDHAGARRRARSPVARRSRRSIAIAPASKMRPTR